jgi:hypothetical protein
MIKKACLILGISIFSSLAFGEKCKEDLCSNRTEKDAVKILKQYSKLIACNV